MIALYVLILLACGFTCWQAGQLWDEYRERKADLDQRDQWAKDYIKRQHRKRERVA